MSRGLAWFSNRVNRALLSLDRMYLRGKEGGDCRPLFVLGVPRSGTTLAYQCICHWYRLAYLTRYMNVLHGMHGLLYRLSRSQLKQAPAVFASDYGTVPGYALPAESGRLWSRWFPWQAGGDHRIRPDGLSEAACGELHRHLSALQQIARQPFIYKSVYLALSAGALARCLPRARFIMVTRDPAATVMSLYRKRLRQRDPHCWWSVVPPGVDRLARLPLEIQLAEQVIRVGRILREDLRSQADGRYLELDYSSLCDSPGAVAVRIDEWMVAAGYERNPGREIPARFVRGGSGEEVPEEVRRSIYRYIERAEDDGSGYP